MNKFSYDQKIAMIGMGGVALAFIFFVLGLKTDSGVLVIIGVAVFILTILGTTVIANIVNMVVDARWSKKRINYLSKVTGKYQSLLADERTKQDPDVQRLLQYLSVQKAFFDPDYIYSSAAQNDPYVRELIEVFERMLSNGMGINGDFGGRVNINPNSAYVSELNSREAQQREREKTRPRKITGNVMVLIGMMMFFVPFFVVLFGGIGKNSVYVFVLSPIGIMLAIIGSIVKKQ